MNLLEKLRSLEKTQKAAEKGPVFTECLVRTEKRPAGAFPDQSFITRDALGLIRSQDLPLPGDPVRILYLDTETTGLRSGAGTVAFEVGCGHMEPHGFVLNQYVMRDYPEEPFLLEKVREEIEKCDLIVTFNGKTFDLPLLQTRFLMNRVSAACLDRPHLDLLHAGRRLWKRRLEKCTLSNLEAEILGQPRCDDLPGSEAPARYFAFLKTGNFGLLEDVLRHNAQDVASMCMLLGKMCRLYAQPEQIGFSEDLFSMGDALEKEELRIQARRIYRMVPRGRLHGQARARLAHSFRRFGSPGEARDVWLEMIESREGGILPFVELAKYYEHTEPDLEKALEMTEKALAVLSEDWPGRDSGTVQKSVNALQYRHMRLRKKLAAAGTCRDPKERQGD